MIKQKKIRPLTTRMVEILKMCHTKEVSNQAPLSIYYSQSAKGLLLRGLFYTKQYSKCERPYEGFYLTPLGLEYLTKIDGSPLTQVP